LPHSVHVSYVNYTTLTHSQTTTTNYLFHLHIYRTQHKITDK